MASSPWRSANVTIFLKSDGQCVATMATINRQKNKLKRKMLVKKSSWEMYSNTCCSPPQMVTKMQTLTPHMSHAVFFLNRSWAMAPLQTCMCEKVVIRFKVKARVCQTHLTMQTDSLELILQNIKDGLDHWENRREWPQKRRGRTRDMRSGKRVQRVDGKKEKGRRRDWRGV